jgi:AraC-like DNA-binding protein
MRHFSTASIPEKDRPAYSREFYGRQIWGVDLVSAFSGPPSHEQSMTTLPDLHLAISKDSGSQYLRTRALLADGNDDLHLHCVDSPGTVIQCGREQSVSPGDAFIFSKGDIGLTHFPHGGGSLSRVMPRRLIKVVAPAMENRIAECIPANTLILCLLKHYVSEWQHGALATTPAMQRTLSAHIYDLIALLFNAHGDTAEQAAQGGGHAAQLALIRREIEKGFNECDFSLSILAQRAGSTPRHVQRVLERADSYFLKEVTGRRIQLAHRLLQSPSHRHTSVIDIAYLCGFNSAGHFHRLFRRTHAMSPGEARNDAGGRVSPALQ